MAGTINIGTLAAQLGANTTELAKAVSQVDALTRKMEGRLSSTEKTSKKMSTGMIGSFAKVVASIAGVTGGIYLLQKAIRSGLTAFIEFDKAMAQVGSVAIDANAKQKEYAATLKILSDYAREQARTSVFTARESANAQYYLASAGMSVNQIMSAQRGVMDLAAATQHDLAETSRIVASTLSQFTLGAEQATKVADIFTKAIGLSQATMSKLGVAMTYAGPAAAGMGQSLEMTTSQLMSLFNAGFDASQAGTALRRAMLDLTDPTDKATKEFKKLGINIKDTETGAVRPFMDILKDLEKKQADVASLTRIFGLRAGPAMAALLSQGTAAIERYNTQLEAAAGTAAKVAERQMDTLWGDLKKLASQAEETAIKFFEKLSPSLRETTQEMTKFIKSSETGLIPIAKDIGVVIGFMAGIIRASAEAWVYMKLIGAMAMQTLYTYVAGSVKKITDLFAKWFEKVPKWFDLTGGYAKLATFFRGVSSEINAGQEVVDTALKNTTKQLTDLQRGSAAADLTMKDAVNNLKKYSTGARDSVWKMTDSFQGMNEASKRAQKMLKDQTNATRNLGDESDKTSKKIKKITESIKKTTKEETTAAYKIWAEYDRQTLASQQYRLNAQVAALRQYKVSEEQIWVYLKDKFVKLESDKAMATETFLGGVWAGYLQLQAKQKTWADVGLSMFKTFTDQSATLFKDGFVALINGDLDDLGASFSKFLDAMVDAFISAVARMLAEWATFQLVTSIGGALGINIGGYSLSGGGGLGGLLGMGVQGYSLYKGGSALSGIGSWLGLGTATEATGALATTGLGELGSMGAGLAGSGLIAGTAITEASIGAASTAALAGGATELAGIMGATGGLGAAGTGALATLGTIAPYAIPVILGILALSGSGGLDGIVKGIGNVVGGIASGIGSVVEGVGNAIGGIGEGIGNFVSSIFADGTPYVADTGPAYVHQGERILSAMDNERLIAAVTSGGRTVNIHFHGPNIIDDSSMDRFVEKIRETLDEQESRIHG